MEVSPTCCEWLDDIREQGYDDFPNMSTSKMQSPGFPVAHAIGFISDIHGHLAPLTAVLEEFKARKVERIGVAGDLFFGGDTPFEVWSTLQETSALCIRGASDTALIKLSDSKLIPMNDDERNRFATFKRTREALGEIVLAHVRKMPEELRIPILDGREILMVHGSPADPLSEMTVDMSDDEIRELLGGEHADIIVCGASHVPFYRVIDEQHIINVGSVGEAPGNVAHYTVVRPNPGTLEVEQSWVSL